jgi:hypothetical protein
MAEIDRALENLARMATERVGFRSLIFGRWYYSHEPLRNDAANLLRSIGISHMMPVNTRLVGDE